VPEKAVKLRSSRNVYEEKNRRCKIEIVLEVLEIAKHGTNKTRIIYGANLNFKKATAIIEEIISLGLLSVERVDGRVVYRTTEKGMNLLRVGYELLSHFE